MRFYSAIAIALIIAGAALFSVHVRFDVGTEGAFRLVQETQQKQVQQQKTETQLPLTVQEQKISTKTYFYGSSLLASKSNNAVTYYHHDYLGSTRLQTDNSGNKKFSTRTAPFGSDVAVSGSAASAENAYKFTGQETDENLYYYGARYYDTKAGRFTQIDPVFTAETPYSYVRNNPLKFVDSTGMQQEQVDQVNFGMGDLKLYEYEQQPEPAYSEFVSSYPTRKGDVNEYVGTGFDVRPVIWGTDYEIVDMPVLCAEQTCADTQVALNAEYQRRYKDDVAFTLASGQIILWSGWQEDPKQYPKTNLKNYPKTWEGFLMYVFTYINTGTLRRTLQKVTVDDLQPGDLILETGDDYAHTIAIKRIETDQKTGERLFWLFAGSDPAIDPRIYKSPISEGRIRSNIGDGFNVLRRFP